MHRPDASAVLDAGGRNARAGDAFQSPSVGRDGAMRCHPRRMCLEEHRRHRPRALSGRWRVCQRVERPTAKKCSSGKTRPRWRDTCSSLPESTYRDRHGVATSAFPRLFRSSCERTPRDRAISSARGDAARAPRLVGPARAANFVQQRVVGRERRPGCGRADRAG